MNFYEYLGISPPKFCEKYLKTDLVVVQYHAEFPLAIYSYGRRAVMENVWDSVTSKCRGIIVNRDSGEIVARPFEKFHNYGSTQAANLYNPVTEEMLRKKPVIWEKLDGFMCTAYRWQGEWYAASKGSFHSLHAKWATIELQRVMSRDKWKDKFWPAGYTPVFEGLHRDLRIVVDYGSRQGLVLLALINNETGYELPPPAMRFWADRNGFDTPRLMDMSLEQAREESLKENRDGLGREEGYVLTWYYGKDGYLCKPSRLKMKFVDYLRLHRMVSGVSPWRIWEALSTDEGNQIVEWLDTQNQTPWFQKFVQKWVTALSQEFTRQKKEATGIFERTVEKVGIRPSKDRSRVHCIRRAFAKEFTRPENKKYASALFKMLDNEDADMSIWKYVEGMTKNGDPLRAHQFS